jgi:N-methylhydantoinase A/oxoprolinase/acetone carboxylase beta subunit
MHLGSDTGGTFTDLVDETGRATKVLSTPDDPGRALRTGVAMLAEDRQAEARQAESGSYRDEGTVVVGTVGAAEVRRPELLAHGTTVATNALLERRGARTALVATSGLGDVIEIARQDRPRLYDAAVRRPEPLVARADRLEVPGRLAADGAELVALDTGPLAGLDPGVQAVAVCLLHSDLDDRHERAVADALAVVAPQVDVSLSCEVSPEYREYERTVTTAANAFVGPVCRRYLGGLAALADEVLVLTSEGGLVPLAEAAHAPARLLLSGPAGGARAAAAVAAANGFADVLAFDMGGTSTDVCLVLDGRPEPAGLREVAGLPIRLPSLDVHTVGAGGGSIASVDAGGALVVGPRSAGARPGPACYGLGGSEPTVTDANLVAGRLPADAQLPGLGRLDRVAAAAALERAGVTAEGVLAVVDATMARALRHVSVERGVDPRGLALVAFGGAGPLHACALADELGIEVVLVPPRAGVFSAVGVLCSPRQHEVVHTWPTPLDHTGIDEALATLAAEARAVVAGGGRADVEVEVAFDCRYQGQSHEIRVGAVGEFAAEHRRRNGYDRPGRPVEVMALRAVARRPAPLDIVDLPAPERTGVMGPAVVAEADCTIWVPAGWQATVGAVGTLVLRRLGES